MKLIVLCILFLGLSSAHHYETGKPANLNCNCGWTTLKMHTTKIYPWVVAIISSTSRGFICHGTILTEYHILTSASYLIDRKSNEILVCLRDGVESKCGSRFPVEKISTHTEFRLVSPKYVYNLSIIKTKNEIIFKKSVGPACFPHKEMSNEMFVNTNLMFLGWDSGEVKSTNFIVEKQEKCKAKYGDLDDKIHICAVSSFPKYIAADGGGSFVMYSEATKRYSLVGVLDSFSWKTDNPPVPSVLTNFTAFIQWTSKIVSRTQNVELCYQKE